MPFFLLQGPTLHSFTFKGGLSGVGQFLTTESPFRMMKNAFYFTSKTLFVLKIFEFYLSFKIQ